MLKVTI